MSRRTIWTSMPRDALVKALAEFEGGGAVDFA